MADEAQKAGLIADFAGVTGVDADRAKFYLESSGWQLQIALGSFYDNDGGNDGADDDVLFHEASDEFRPSNLRQPEVVDLSADEPETEGAPLAVRGTGRNRPPAPSSRFHTVSDFARDTGADSDSDEEGQAFYAGGADHGSGQQVVGPRKKKSNTDSMINDLFKSAREHGAQEVGAGSSSTSEGTPSSFIFKGAGYRLGDSESGPARPEPGTVGTLPGKEPRGRNIILKLWRNGFSVDDGELRGFKDPQNADFLNAISKGQIPMELIREAKGGEVNLDLEDHRDEEYTRPKVKVKPFSGQGSMLGSPVPTVVSTPASASAAKQDEASANQSVSLDESQPVTSIQIRLADGTRLVRKFNHSHTVADVRRYITTARPVYAGQLFALMTTFPNKELTEDSQTLADGKLLNAVIVQRLK
ncbi:NSFL1 cofactor p47-like [Acanthaster planci]|uniref:NSFL1 cofactor p47 n=1 Tax=Acanthaster planci TaxID=133434 RepID=A0A8B7YNV3_ACAPL|nr:NSFL1 cofactor p47-like [Acanthaster planci]